MENEEYVDYFFCARSLGGKLIDGVGNVKIPITSKNHSLQDLREWIAEKLGDKPENITITSLTRI